MPATTLLLASSPRTPRPRHRLHAADGPPGSGAAQRPRQGGAAGGQPVLRILVVDDDPLMTDLLPRKITRALLSPRAQIMTARTPDEGIRLAIDERPDVVLSDFNLRSSRDGLDVLEAVGRVCPDAVRILFSAHTRHEVGPRLAAADIHGFVEKTMRLDDMMDPLFEVISTATGVPIERAPPTGSR